MSRPAASTGMLTGAMMVKNFTKSQCANRGDQQVLGLAHQRAHAAQRRTHRAMHQQASQEGPEVFQVFAVQVVYAVIHRVVVPGVPVLPEATL